MSRSAVFLHDRDKYLDFPDPRAEGEAIAALMPAAPSATVAVVPGAGHYLHAQSPDEVAAPVIPFLANLESVRESRQ